MSTILRILFFICILLSTGCASTYKPLNPQSLSYSNEQVIDKLKFAYNDKAFEQTRNRKYIRKAVRKQVNIVAVRITNASNTSINIKSDLVLKADQAKLICIQPENVKRLLRQHSFLYFLGMCGISIVSTSASTVVYFGIYPFNAVYVLPNFIVAASANKNFLEELSFYNIESMEVPAYSVRYGILSYYAPVKRNIHVTQFQNMIIDSSNSQMVQVEVPAIQREENKKNEWCGYDTANKQDEYYTNALTTLKENPIVQSARINVNYYRNGKIKFIGLKVRHTAGVENYEYKTGTWRYYYENGNLKTLIDYDMYEQKNGRYEKYDESGNLIEKKKYFANNEIRQD